MGCRLGLRPEPRWGSFQRSPNPLAVKGEGGGLGARKEVWGLDAGRVSRGGEGMEGKWRGGEKCIVPPHFWAGASFEQNMIKFSGSLFLATNAENKSTSVVYLYCLSSYSLFNTSFESIARDSTRYSNQESCLLHSRCFPK